jgi:hypothetical protein
MVLQILGEPADTGWGSLSDRGATLGKAEDYPSGAEIAGIMREVSKGLGYPGLAD